MLKRIKTDSSLITDCIIISDVGSLADNYSNSI